MASLKNEIAQQRPFASVEEEALLNLMRGRRTVFSAHFSAPLENGVLPPRSTTY